MARKREGRALPQWKPAVLDAPLLLLGDPLEDALCAGEPGPGASLVDEAEARPRVPGQEGHVIHAAENPIVRRRIAAFEGEVAACADRVGDPRHRRALLQDIAVAANQNA